MVRSKRRHRPRASAARTVPTVAARPTQAVLPASSLGDLRRTLGVTQVELAKMLDGSQRAVSHLEHEANPRISTLAVYLRALGGQLQLQAVFDDRVVDLELPQAPRSAVPRTRDGQAADGTPRAS